jgi:hypothetical protein
MTQLERLCRKLNIRTTCEYGAVEVPEGWGAGTHPWKVRLRFGRRSLTVPFFQGCAHTSEPTAADVLSSLALDARAGDQSFEEFCGDYGYDPDSRTAERTWKACARTAPRLRRFLGDHFDEIANAEH